MAKQEEEEGKKNFRKLLHFSVLLTCLGLVLFYFICCDLNYDDKLSWPDQTHTHTRCAKLEVFSGICVYSVLSYATEYDMRNLAFIPGRY